MEWMNGLKSIWLDEWMNAHGGQSIRHSKSPEGSHRSL